MRAAREYLPDGQIDPEAARMLAEERAVVRATNAILGALSEQGVSKAELAKRLGVSRARVSRALRGDSNLTVRTVAGMAWALDLRLLGLSLGRACVPQGPYEPVYACALATDSGVLGGGGPLPPIPESNRPVQAAADHELALAA